MNKVKDSLRFLWNRMVRIYPLHVLTFLAVVCVFYWWKIPVPTFPALMNVCLLQSWVHNPSVYFSFNSLSWFLSTLCFCYIVFAVAMLKPKVLVPMVFVISSVSITVSIACINRASSGWPENADFFLYIFPLNRLFTFLCGVGCSILFLKLHSRLTPLVGPVSGTVLEVIVLGLLLERIFAGNLSKLLFDAARHVHFLRYTGYHVADNYLFCGLLSLSLLFIFGLERGVGSRVFRQRPLVFLGDISFSIFIIHQILFRFIGFWKDNLISAHGEMAVGVAAILAVFPVATLAYWLVEHPIVSRFKVRGARPTAL